MACVHPQRHLRLLAVAAEVPLAEMFGYVTTLRGMTQGRGSSSMEFAHYAALPRSLAEEVVSKKEVNKGREL